MTTLLYLVRPGDHNPELQYSLRSVERNLLMPDLNVVTVGYCPRWLNPDYHVQGNRLSTSPENVWDNVRIGCKAFDTLDEVIIMNDDFFVLDPTIGIVPTYRGTMAEHLATLGPNKANWWARSLHLTNDWLVANGFEEPLSYELHRPFPVDPARMANCLEAFESDSNLDTVPPQWRTIYGNMTKMQAHQAIDVRMRRNGAGTPVGTAWVSTSDEVWRAYSATVGRFLDSKSRWER